MFHSGIEEFADCNVILWELITGGFSRVTSIVQVPLILLVSVKDNAINIAPVWSGVVQDTFIIVSVDEFIVVVTDHQLIAFQFESTKLQETLDKLLLAVAVQEKDAFDSNTLGIVSELITGGGSKVTLILQLPLILLVSVKDNAINIAPVWFGVVQDTFIIVGVDGFIVVFTDHQLIVFQFESTKLQETLDKLLLAVAVQEKDAFDSNILDIVSELITGGGSKVTLILQLPLILLVSVKDNAIIIEPVWFGVVQDTFIIVGVDEFIIAVIDHQIVFQSESVKFTLTIDHKDLSAVIVYQEKDVFDPNTLGIVSELITGGFSRVTSIVQVPLILLVSVKDNAINIAPVWSGVVQDTFIIVSVDEFIVVVTDHQLIAFQFESTKLQETLDKLLLAVAVQEKDAFDSNTLGIVSELITGGGSKVTLILQLPLILLVSVKDNAINIAPVWFGVVQDTFIIVGVDGFIVVFTDHQLIVFQFESTKLQETLDKLLLAVAVQEKDTFDSNILDIVSELITGGSSKVTLILQLPLILLVSVKDNAIIIEPVWFGVVQDTFIIVGVDGFIVVFTDHQLIAFQFESTKLQETLDKLLLAVAVQEKDAFDSNILDIVSELITGGGSKVTLILQLPLILLVSVKDNVINIAPVWFGVVQDTFIIVGVDGFIVAVIDHQIVFQSESVKFTLTIDHKDLSAVIVYQEKDVFNSNTLGIVSELIAGGFSRVTSIVQVPLILLVSVKDNAIIIEPVWFGVVQDTFIIVSVDGFIVVFTDHQLIAFQFESTKFQETLDKLLLAVAVQEKDAFDSNILDIVSELIAGGFSRVISFFQIPLILFVSVRDNKINTLPVLFGVLQDISIYLNEIADANKVHQLIVFQFESTKTQETLDKFLFAIARIQRKGVFNSNTLGIVSEIIVEGACINIVHFASWWFKSSTLILAETDSALLEKKTLVSLWLKGWM